MPLPLPILDTRTFEELVEEGRSLLPRSTTRWTDHNLSDPGITLLELFAYLAEANMYRLDQLPPASLRAFLRLLGVAPRPIHASETVVALTLEPPGPAEVALAQGTALTLADGRPTFLTQHDLTVSPARLVWWAQDTAADVPLSLRLDRPPATTAAELSLYLRTNVLGAAERDSRERLKAEAALAAVRSPDCTPVDWRLHYAVRTVWEYRRAPGDDWAPLDVLVDETRALTLSGFVRFRSPLDLAVADLNLRCRRISGRYDCRPALAGIGWNAVTARAGRDSGGEMLLGRSDGGALQQFGFPDRPILPGSVAVRVVAPDGTQDATWTEAPSWDDIGPHQRRYVLDSMNGVLAFGDGRVGRVPPTDAEIWATKWQVGGGPDDDLPAGSLTQVLGRSDLVVEQPQQSFGGAWAEPIESAQARALALLAQPTRGVSLADIAALALATPGVPVARARARADRHPLLPCYPAEGSVTVVVIPDCSSPALIPTPQLLAAVAAWLEPRRPVTTEIHVVGPRYRQVAVDACLVASDATASSELIAQAETALATFMHPLKGGPDGSGWPPGRDVYRTEMMALLAALPGVAQVTSLGLRTTGDTESRCGNLSLCSDELPVPGGHELRVAEQGGRVRRGVEKGSGDL